MPTAVARVDEIRFMKAHGIHRCVDTNTTSCEGEWRDLTQSFHAHMVLELELRLVKAQPYTLRRAFIWLLSPPHHIIPSTSPRLGGHSGWAPFSS